MPPLRVRFGYRRRQEPPLASVSTLPPRSCSRPVRACGHADSADAHTLTFRYRVVANCRDIVEVRNFVWSDICKFRG